MEKEEQKLNRNEETSICFIVACNDDDVLNSTLLSSPDLSKQIEVNIQKNALCAAEAYNSGIDQTENEIMVFVHQDVYLPKGWIQNLKTTLEILNEKDRNWGVLGLYGKDHSNVGVGYVYSTGLKRHLGQIFNGVKIVETLDEMVLILRRSSALRFDESIPGFHLYGTDICMQARKKKMNSYVFSALAIHNSNGMRILPKAYWEVFIKIRRKWIDELPIMTTCMPVTYFCIPIILYCLKKLVIGSKKPGTRYENPEKLWKKIISENKLQ